MTKLGTDKRPAIIRVQTTKRAEEIIALCNDRGWKVIAGIEPDKLEDISDVERLLASNTMIKDKQKAGRKVGPNDYCPCGSGLKYKKCCLKKYE